MSKETLSAAPSRSLQDILTERGTLPPRTALAVFRQLLTQVRALHVAGRTHRAIGPDTVRLDAAGRATLSAPEPSRPFGGPDADAESSPPELHGGPAVQLPAEIEAARQELSRAGVALDPRRIDVYQLGALLCRMITGEAVSTYLRSPKAKAKVPAPVRPLIEHALGYSAAARFLDCDQYAAALEPLFQKKPAPETPPGGSAAASPLKAPADETPLPTASSPCRPAGAGDLPFSRLGHYRVDGRIGHGGMGDVYLGYEESLQRRVAIKVLPADLARDEDFVRRFQAEATAAAKLTHPNIVPIYFIGQDAGCHYFAMQFVEGESLERLLARRGRLKVEEVVGILEQCLAGLGAAHQAGLVHRDVKPGNILLDGKSGNALVADFGLVKTSGDGMTATGVVLGTVDYIAPEQGRGQAVDGRADLYALGVLAYRMLSGRLPFQAETPSVMIFQHVYENPPPLREVAPKTPEPVADIVDRLMAKDPAARHQTAEEVLADLRRWRAGEPMIGKAAPPPEGRPSQVIQAPSFERAPKLPLHLGSAAATSWWQRLRDRVMYWYQGHAPEALKALQHTEQQVDGAVAEYQRRRDRLASLVSEGTEAAAELAAQAESHRTAAAAAARRAESADDDETARRAVREKEECERVAADLAAQAVEQQEQIAEMGQHLHKVDATLKRLCSQRDLLRGRLRVAQANLRLDRGIAHPRLRRRFVAIAAGLGLLLMAGAVVCMLAFRGDAQNPIPLPVAKPTSAPSQPSATDPVIKANPAPPALDKPPPVIHPLHTYTGHTGQVVSVDLSPDGHRIISGGKDKTMRMWDVESGDQLYVRTEKTYWIECVAFSPSGKQAVSSGDQLARDGTFLLHLWDVNSGQEVRSFMGHALPVQCATFSDDGGQVLSGSVDRTLCLWETASGRKVREFKGHTNGVTCVALSADGRRALSGGGESGIRLWDVASGDVVHVFTGDVGTVNGVAFCRDGRHAASVSTDNTIRVWDLEAGQEWKRFPLNTKVIPAAALSQDGRRALIAFGDGTIRLWDVEGGKELASLQGHTGNAQSVAFSRDDRRAVSGGDDATVRLWDLTSRQDGVGKPDAPVPEEKPTEEMTNSLDMKLVLIHAGTFTMGSPNNEVGQIPNERPQHEVTISRPFYMGAFPVTQGEYERLIGKNPSWFSKDGRGEVKVVGLDTKRFPVETVSWDEAVAFCAALDKTDTKKPAAWSYGLPTEAEWEYACRAGTTTAYYFGADPKLLGDYAWYNGNSEDTTHEVGTRKPNPWGLFDMHGNVSQWCADGYRRYENQSVIDPFGRDSAEGSSTRGGGREAWPVACRSGYRFYVGQGYHFNDVGIRVVLRPPGGIKPEPGKPAAPAPAPKP